MKSFSLPESLTNSVLNLFSAQDRLAVADSCETYVDLDDYFELMNRCSDHFNRTMQMDNYRTLDIPSIFG